MGVALFRNLRTMEGEFMHFANRIFCDNWLFTKKMARFVVAWVKLNLG